MTATIELEATLVGSAEPGAWTYAIVPNSAAILGTRKPVRVTGTVDGEQIAATLLPMGDGTHMLPVKAAVRQAIGKQAGDSVRAQLRSGGMG